MRNVLSLAVEKGNSREYKDERVTVSYEQEKDKMVLWFNISGEFAGLDLFGVLAVLRDSGHGETLITDTQEKGSSIRVEVTVKAEAKKSEITFLERTPDCTDRYEVTLREEHETVLFYFISEGKPYCLHLISEPAPKNWKIYISKPISFSNC